MKSSVLQLNIISAEKELFSGSVSSVVVPGISGRFGILPGHAPLISSLQEGIVEYQHDGKTEKLDVEGGVIEVNSGVVTICVV